MAAKRVYLRSEAYLVCYDFAKDDNRPRGQQPNSGFLFRAKTRSLSPVL